MSLIGDFSEYFLKLKNNQYTANNYLHVLSSTEPNTGKKITLNPSAPDSTKNDGLIKHEYLNVYHKHIDLLLIR